MDLETIVKRIEELELQLDSLRKSLSNQNNRIGSIDEKTTGFLEQIRDQKNEISKIAASLESKNQFDAVLTKTRVDFNKQIEESEKRQKLNLKMQEKLFDDHLKSIEAKMKKSHEEMEVDLKTRLKEYGENETKLLQGFKELEQKLENELRDDEDIKGSLNILQSTVTKNSRAIDTFTTEFSVYRERVDEIREKLKTISDNIRTNESQLKEIVATETERKQSFIAFMEQQALTKNERDRTWLEWQDQIEEVINLSNNLIPELEKKRLNIEKNEIRFNEVIDQIDRRINEVTEMFRLMDEKFRKEWETFQSEQEKRFTSMKLILEEKQKDITENFDEFKERITSVEDDSQDMQDVLILMSREIQKGMQSLMGMVNGWINAFDQIKTDKS